MLKIAPKKDPCANKNWGLLFFFEEHDSFKTSLNKANTCSVLIQFRNLHLCSSSLQYNPDFLFNPISLIIHNLLIE